MKKLKRLDLQRSGLEDVSWLKDMNQLLMLDIRFNPRVHDYIMETCYSRKRKILEKVDREKTLQNSNLLILINNFLITIESSSPHPVFLNPTRTDRTRHKAIPNPRRHRKPTRDNHPMAYSELIGLTNDSDSS
jgi:hypothetical protein